MVFDFDDRDFAPVRICDRTNAVIVNAVGHATHHCGCIRTGVDSRCIREMRITRLHQFEAIPFGAGYGR